MTEVKIPSVGESITSGILAKWHVRDGDAVTRGQTIFELETDKITSEAQAEVAGKISLKVAVGAEVAIGQVVAVIDEAATAPAASAPAAPNAAPTAPAADLPLSPAARRAAAELHVDPATVAGTGKGGRVTKSDLEAAAVKPAAPAAAPLPSSDLSIPPFKLPPAAQAAAAPKAAPAAPAPAGERTTRSRLSPLRKRIAERLVAAQRTAAILTTFNEADMSAVMALRKQHQEDFTARHGIKLGFMSFFVKAVVNALRAVPEVNAQLEGDELVENHYYDIGVAVGTERGLLVPVVRDCDRLSFAEIEKSIAEYAKRAREGKIKIEELQGGVFTISNGGIYGSMLSTPILNPPQSGILGLHNITERPVVRGGQIVARPMMYLALSYDHRVVDGSEAVTFLVRVKEAIEDPARLLFGL